MAVERCLEEMASCSSAPTYTSRHHSGGHVFKKVSVGALTVKIASSLEGHNCNQTFLSIYIQYLLISVSCICLPQDLNDELLLGWGPDFHLFILFKQIFCCKVSWSITELHKSHFLCNQKAWHGSHWISFGPRSLSSLKAWHLKAFQTLCWIVLPLLKNT